MEGSVRLLSDIASDTRVALRARWCGVMVLIEDSQHVLASSGGMLGIYRRSTALSSYVVSEPQHPFIVLDAAADARFTGNPFVDDGLIGFYAGAAVMDPQGYAIGAVCVTSRSARLAFSKNDVSALLEAAEAVCSAVWHD